MLIYRLERDKTGVYQTGLLHSISFFCLKNTYVGDKTLHPSPFNDSKFLESCRLKNLSEDGWVHKYVFGFESPKQLLRWFYDYDDLRELGKNKIIISVYNCEDVIVGNTQVAFNQEFHNNTAPEKQYTVEEFLELFG